MTDQILRGVRRELARLAVTKLVAGQLSASESTSFKRLCAFERAIINSRERDPATSAKRGP